MPAEIKRALEEKAKYNKRTLNSEIVLRLEQSLGIIDSAEGESQKPVVYKINDGGLERVPDAAELEDIKARHRAGVDHEKLTIILSAGEAYLQKIHRELPPDKRAKLYDVMYDFCESRDCDFDQATLQKLVDLAS